MSSPTSDDTKRKEQMTKARQLCENFATAKMAGSDEDVAEAVTDLQEAEPEVLYFILLYASQWIGVI